MPFPRQKTDVLLHFLTLVNSSVFVGKEFYFNIFYALKMKS